MRAGATRKIFGVLLAAVSASILTACDGLSSITHHSAFIISLKGRRA
jgi:hypothetical protein